MTTIENEKGDLFEAVTGIYLFEMTTTESKQVSVIERFHGIYLLEMTTIENSNLYCTADLVGI